MATYTLTLTLTQEQVEIIGAALAKSAQIQAESPKVTKSAKAKQPKADNKAKQPKAEVTKAKPKATKSPKAKKERKPDFTGKSGYGYAVVADVDTRDNSPLWCVRICDTLTSEQYLAEKAAMKELGGYYSKFKHAFVFKTDPTSALKG